MKRIPFLDYLRAAACLTVIIVHACEFYYIGDGGIVRDARNGIWVSLIDSLFRPAVPIFVMISAYLLLPVKGSTTDFFRRRFTRVAIPFAVWSVLYAVLPWAWGEFPAATVVSNLGILTLNFVPSAGHLWYLYMFLGVYLFMPVISPWLEQVSRRGEEAFLGLWLLTTLWHYGLIIFPEGILGACSWNEFHLLYNFSGYIGYIVLAHYIRTYLDWSPKRSLCIGLPLLAAGYAVTAAVFHHRLWTADNFYDLEISWRFCTLNVAAMSFAIFMIFRSIRWSEGGVYRIVRRLSVLSFGIYLMHIFVLNLSYRLFAAHLSMPAAVGAMALFTFAVCGLIAEGLSRLPGGRYIVG